MSSHRPQRFGQMELYQRGGVIFFFGGHANGLYGILRSRIPSSQEKAGGREGGILNPEIPRSVRAALGVLLSIRHVDVVGLLGFRTQSTRHDWVICIASHLKGGGASTYLHDISPRSRSNCKHCCALV